LCGVQIYKPNLLHRLFGLKVAVMDGGEEIVRRQKSVFKEIKIIFMFYISYLGCKFFDIYLSNRKFEKL
jgi:hypothetical protein